MQLRQRGKRIGASTSAHHRGRECEGTIDLRSPRKSRKQAMMLRRRFSCQIAVLALLLATAEVRASSKPSEADLAGITARGALLAEYDTAAWQATDAVQDAHAVKDRVGRYIGRKTDAGWVVDFGRLNQAQDKFLVAYEAVPV